MDGDLGAVDIGTLVLYFVLLFGVALYVGRRQMRTGGSQTEKYFLAEHSVSWWAVAASLFASNVSWFGASGSSCCSWCSCSCCCGCVVVVVVVVVAIRDAFLPVVMLVWFSLTGLVVCFSLTRRRLDLSTL